MNDSYRAVQNPQSTSIQTFLEVFNQASSGHGHNRVRCLTHDNKKALVQTMHGMIAACKPICAQRTQYSTCLTKISILI